MTVFHLKTTIGNIDRVIDALSTDDRTMSKLVIEICSTARSLTAEKCQQIYKLYIKLGQIRPDIDLRINVESLKGRSAVISSKSVNILDLSNGKEDTSNENLLKTYKNVVLGGTFDRLHVGHKILLTEAVVRCEKKLTVGVTDENMIASKKLWELIEPVETRISVVRNFLEQVDAGLTYEIVPISDMFGPTKSDPDLDLIVVSGETEKGGHKVNEVRKERGLKELDVHIVPLVEADTTDEGDELKISSSNGRLRLLGTLIRKPEPKPGIPDRPYLIGLTGGIASGKSNIAKVLASKGAGVIDCDKIAHKLYRKGTPTYDQVVALFGEKIVGQDDEINRRSLGEIVFNSKEDMEKLNRLLWPAILDSSLEEARRLHEYEGKEVVVLEAAVLLQAGWDKSVHQVWTCIIPPSEAVQRVMSRNSVSENAARARVEAQPSNKEQVMVANVVFCSLYSYEFTRKQVEIAWTTLQSNINNSSVHHKL